MEIDIDPLSATPLYQQIRDRVVVGIARGELAPGTALASVRRLATEFGINIATVGKAYDLLRTEGLVRTNRRSGSVVARGPSSGPPRPEFVADWNARLTVLVAEGRAQGVDDASLHDALERVLAALASPTPHNQENTL